MVNTPKAFFVGGYVRGGECLPPASLSLWNNVESPKGFGLSHPIKHPTVPPWTLKLWMLGVSGWFRVTPRMSQELCKWLGSVGYNPCIYVPFTRRWNNPLKPTIDPSQDARMSSPCRMTMLFSSEFEDDFWACCQWDPWDWYNFTYIHYKSRGCGCGWVWEFQVFQVNCSKFMLQRILVTNSPVVMVHVSRFFQVVGVPRYVLKG